MGKKASRVGKGYYATYKTNNQYAKNKKAKNARHLKKHPNDEQAKNVNLSTTPTRKKPIQSTKYFISNPENEKMYHIFVHKKYAREFAQGRRAVQHYLSFGKSTKKKKQLTKG